MLKPCWPPSPLASRDVDEMALAGVLEQAVLADAGDENVGEAVVVVIADGHAHAVHFDIKPGAARDVREGAVAIVAIEAQRGALALVPWPVHAVDQQDVLPAVAIVIEKRAARSRAFLAGACRRTRRCCGETECRHAPSLQRDESQDPKIAAATASRASERVLKRETPADRRQIPRRTRYQWRFTKCSPVRCEWRKPRARPSCEFRARP